MPRYDRSDILMELIELCRDVKSDVLQQLTYYRASVYKNETYTVIESRLEKLRTIAELCGSETLRDAFHDYDEMKKEGWKHAMPGECLLSHRVATLFASMDTAFAQIQSAIHASSGPDGQRLAKSVQKHRKELLSMCRQGSRQWSFFSGI